MDDYSDFVDKTASIKLLSSVVWKTIRQDKFMWFLVIVWSVNVATPFWIWISEHRFGGIFNIILALAFCIIILACIARRWSKEEGSNIVEIISDKDLSLIAYALPTEDLSRLERYADNGPVCRHHLVELIEYLSSNTCIGQRHAKIIRDATRNKQ